MDTSKELLFKSTGNITLEELTAIYPGMLPGDIVLKFAEHKNFDAARAAFQAWDERSIMEMSNLLSQDYRQEEKSYSTRDKYIAMIFLKALVNEWDANRLEQRGRRLKVPIQQQKAAELLAIRLKGVLPHIDLAGTDFTIDWRLRELRETDEPWKNISFKDMEISESGEEYLCFFNTETHRRYLPEDDITELPENVVVLEIPNELQLDPIAVARESGMGYAELLADHPIQSDLSAKVKPLSESGLPEFIEYNLRNRNNLSDSSERSSKRSR
jgi:hypothetical protein